MIILLIGVTALLLLAANIPLLYGFLHHAPGRRFMGVIAGVRDTNFYFMMMQQADHWRLLLQNKFATGEPSIIYHGFFWALLGQAAHALGLSKLAAFHIARVLAIILFVPAIWYFTTRFLDSFAERATALLLICFGAGLGWIQMLNYYRTGSMPVAPIDIATPEATSLFTLMTFPHLSLALILIAASFGLFSAAVSKSSKALALTAGLCGLILGFIHAVNLVVIFAVLAACSLISLALKKDAGPSRMSFLFGAVAIWPIAYYLYLSLTHPALLPQAPVRSPGPLAYLLGFAPFAALTLLYLLYSLKNRRLPEGDLLLFCWVGANSLLLYSYPLISQEARAVLGLQLPLAALSARAIHKVIVPAASRRFLASSVSSSRLGSATLRTPDSRLIFALCALIVLFTFPSSFCNIIERVSRLKQYPEAFSLSDDEYEALRFLQSEKGRGIVLSGDVIGNYIPGMTGKNSWLGQYDLPSRDSRYRMAKIFFSEMTPPVQRSNFLKTSGLGFVYYGWEERTMGKFNPAAAPELERIFQNQSVAIYRVKESEEVLALGLENLRHNFSQGQSACPLFAVRRQPFRGAASPRSPFC